MIVAKARSAGLAPIGRRRIAVRVGVAVAAGVLVVLAAPLATGPWQDVIDWGRGTPGLSPLGADRLAIWLRKMLHVPLYLLTGMLAWWLMVGMRPRAVWAFALAMGIALLDEGVQGLTPGRTAGITDLGFDALGAAMSIAWLDARAARKAAS